MGFAKNVVDAIKGKKVVKTVSRDYEIRDLAFAVGLSTKALNMHLKEDGVRLPYPKVKEISNILCLSTDDLMGDKPITEADKLIGSSHDEQELVEPVTAGEEEPACSCGDSTGTGQECSECEEPEED
jgi:hypothetical protein